MSTNQVDTEISYKVYPYMMMRRRRRRRSVDWMLFSPAVNKNKPITWKINIIITPKEAFPLEKKCECEYDWSLVASNHFLALVLLWRCWFRNSIHFKWAKNGHQWKKKAWMKSKKKTKLVITYFLYVLGGMSWVDIKRLMVLWWSVIKQEDLNSETSFIFQWKNKKKNEKKKKRKTWEQVLLSKNHIQAHHLRTGWTSWKSVMLFHMLWNKSYIVNPLLNERGIQC